MFAEHLRGVHSKLWITTASHWFRPRHGPLRRVPVRTRIQEDRREGISDTDLKETMDDIPSHQTGTHANGLDGFSRAMYRVGSGSSEAL
jgi:hypothetical protein